MEFITTFTGGISQNKTDDIIGLGEILTSSLLFTSDGSARSPIAVLAWHWLSWNAIAERASDVRVRLEDGHLTSLMPKSDVETNKGLEHINALRVSAPSAICLWVALHFTEPLSTSLSPMRTRHFNCSREDAHSAKSVNSHGGGQRQALTWNLLEVHLDKSEVRRNICGDLSNMAGRYGYLVGDKTGF